MKSLSGVPLFATLWTVAYQAPQSMEFSRQEYWSGLPFSSPGDPPDPRIEPLSPALAGGFFITEPQEKPHTWYRKCIFLVLDKMHQAVYLFIYFIQKIFFHYL